MRVGGVFYCYLMMMKLLVVVVVFGCWVVRVGLSFLDDDLILRLA